MTISTLSQSVSRRQFLGMTTESSGILSQASNGSGRAHTNLLFILICLKKTGNLSIYRQTKYRTPNHLIYTHQHNILLSPSS